MVTDNEIQRSLTWYKNLLRLYPQPFRGRFSEGMAQTFRDLCREHRNAGRGAFALALWVFFETSVGIARENLNHMSQTGKTMLRVALGALAVLMVPLVASQVVDGWNWNPGAFVFLYVLLFGLGMVYAAVSKKMGAWSYRAGVGLALAAGFMLGWSNMVHVTDSENPMNFVYYSVLAVGVAGAFLSRLQPRGLARTLFAMAATLALIALILPSGAPPDMARTIAVWHGVLVVLFTASGLLFGRASLLQSK